jgi:hypothetical protein
MSTHKLATFVLLTVLVAGPARAQEPAKQAPPPASTSQTRPPVAVPAPAPGATPAPPRSFRPSEQVSPGRKVSFPNDI